MIFRRDNIALIISFSTLLFFLACQSQFSSNNDKSLDKGNTVEPIGDNPWFIQWKIEISAPDLNGCAIVHSLPGAIQNFEPGDLVEFRDLSNKNVLPVLQSIRENGMIENTSCYSGTTGDLTLITAIRDGEAVGQPITTRIQLYAQYPDFHHVLNSHTTGFSWLVTHDQGVFFCPNDLLLLDDCYAHLTVSDGLLSDRAEHVLEASDGSFWVVTDAGVTHFTKPAVGAPLLQVFRFSLSVWSPVYEGESGAYLLDDYNGGAWLIEPDGAHHLIKNGTTTTFSADQLGCKDSDDPDADPWSFSDSCIQFAHAAKDGTLWLSVVESDTIGPISRFVKASGLVHISGATVSDYSVSDGLPSNIPFDAYETHEGEIWFRFAGDQRVARFHNDTFSVYTANETTAVLGSNIVFGGFHNGWDNIRGIVEGIPAYHSKEGLSTGFVRKFLTAQNGTMWTFSDGASHIIGAHIDNYAILNIKGPGSWDKPHALEAKDGSTWIATYGSGLWRIAGDRLAYHFPQGTSCAQGGSPGLASSWVFDLIEDNSGRIWASTDGGISRYNANGTFDKNLCNLPTGDLFNAGSGEVWVATPTGICIVYGDADTCTRTISRADVEIFLETMDDWDWGSSPYFSIKLFKSSNGATWLGTPLGLARYQNGEFYRFILADGLPPYSADLAGDPDFVLSENSSLAVTSIYEASDHSLWFGTARRGISHFIPDPSKPAGGTFQNIPISETYYENGASEILEVGPQAFLINSLDGILYLKKGAIYPINNLGSSGTLPIYLAPNGSIWIANWDKSVTILFPEILDQMAGLSN